MLYILAALAGYILCKLTTKPTTSPFFQETVINNVMQGKQVTIAVDAEATIFKLTPDGTRMQIVRGIADTGVTPLYTEETLQ